MRITFSPEAQRTISGACHYFLDIKLADLVDRNGCHGTLRSVQVYLSISLRYPLIDIVVKFISIGSAVAM
jgi:hypothetical protein